MSRTKFIFLLVLVIGSAGLSIWVAYMAMQADALDGTVFRTLLPLLMLASIAIRLLTKDRTK